MLGTARGEYPPTEPAVVEMPSVAVLLPPAPAPIERRTERIARPKAGARAPLVDDLEAPGAQVEPPVVIAAPAPSPTAAAPTAPVRTATLAASLAACSGNFFTRTACEHRTRAQYCEGKWGETPQCPAGVANDHGQ